MEEFNKIIINEESLPKNLIKILAHLCIEFQKRYDIYPCLLNQLINDMTFLKNGSSNTTKNLSRPF